MKTADQIEAMRRHAYAMQISAADRRRNQDEDTATQLAYAQGVEAALLWTAGDIGEIPDFDLPKGR